jgi:hypothetical protein
MLSGCLVLSLMAATPGDIVLARQVQTTPERAADVIDRIHGAVTALRVPVRPPAETRARLKSLELNPESCAARRPCLAKLLERLGGSLLITVDVGHIADEMAVGLEALNAEGQAVAERRFTLKTAGYPAGFENEVSAFADALKPFASMAPVDAPLAQANPLTPPPPPPSVPAGLTPHTVAALTAGGVAVGTAATSVIFAILGANANTQLSAARFNTSAGTASHLTQPQAQALATAANTDFSLSLGFGLATAALAGVVMWALLAPEPTP